MTYFKKMYLGNYLYTNSMSSMITRTNQDKVNFKEANNNFYSMIKIINKEVANKFVKILHQ